MVGILQDDFENGMVKSSLLELFSLPPPSKSLKEVIKDQTSQLGSPLGEKIELPGLVPTQMPPEARYSIALCAMPTEPDRTWKNLNLD